MSTPLVVSVTDELVAELEEHYSEITDPLEFGDGAVRRSKTIMALLAERTELKRDAERYRWLREQEAERGISVVSIGVWERAATCTATTFPDPSSLDAAIDAAMQSEDKP